MANVISDLHAAEHCLLACIHFSSS